MDEKKLEMVQKIIKLLNLADEKQNPNEMEREAAKNMAAELMAKHAISFTEINAEGNGNKGPGIDITEMPIEMLRDFYQEWEGMLALALADSFDSKCKVFTYTTGNPRMMFVGEKSDLEVIEYFLTYLRRTIGVMQRTYPGRSKRDYSVGVSMSICRRLREMYMKREEIIPSECRALIIRKTADVDNYIKRRFNEPFGRRPLREARDIRAFAQGYTDGEKVDVSRPLSGSGSPREQIR